MTNQPRFADCGDVLVNLSYVATIIRRSAQRERPESFILRGAAGETLGEAPAWALGVEDLTQALLPAGAGQSAVVIALMTDPGARPCVDDLFVEHHPIVAWRVHSTDCTPILVEAPTARATVLIVCPDGRLLALDGDSYANVEDAKAGVLAQAQGDFDYAATRAKDAVR